ncbi:MAG: AAC(3)-I family aminoglycoside N-acetyltransferase [Cyanophyceae cyanobacterium]
MHVLSPESIKIMRQLLDVFGEVFEDSEGYCEKQPTDSYLQNLLSQGHFIAIAATHFGKVIGGLTAYELQKFEQERSEIYIYDLGVLSHHRRQGIATACIEKLVEIAAERGAYVVFVQADQGDEPAIALYSKLGAKEEVLHFDIAVRQ